ncbi:GNAT family N-acetyltransferase [Paenibacillus cremeus]|uniref:GNAT family N-acetyltransferase n=1 Tax=Paenibacillus cremeus TaxID=2163881 RepID=A0A559K524_9BACL|nr:GNAT family N-acetyltransferase [Paenibacillus cremeus]TVY07207.1 GNAT family N-acetyltransferase [Paenibacillus cremeus]
MEIKVDYKLRNVTLEECDLIFEWANDKTVRENSFNSNELNYDEHVSWFSNKLASNDSYFYIFEANNKKVGMIRLENNESNSFIINYSISREHRGQGYATALLKLIKDRYINCLLIGKVKSCNIASIKAFIRAGYIMKEESEINVFYSQSQ